MIYALIAAVLIATVEALLLLSGYVVMKDQGRIISDLRSRDSLTPRNMRHWEKSL